MLELPEALTLARQLNESVAGKTVSQVFPPSKEHKFCWYAGDPAAYDAALRGAALVSAEAFGMYAEMTFSNGQRLCVNDGVNVRLVPLADAPKAYQLMIAFTDGQALAFTVAMYGGIILHGGAFDNEYYRKSRAYVSPFSPEFQARFFLTLAESKMTLSAKAFIATEQRFPGVGNGVSQDILFNARIHPKRKLHTLSDGDRRALYDSLVNTLRDMRDQGGRDTEKDLFARAGGYRTQMSKNALEKGCPICGGEVVKEAYLGGSVYYCPHCQPL